MKISKKATVFFAVVTLLFSITVSAQQTKISGTISGENAKRIKVTNVAYNGNLLTLKVDEQQQFGEVLNLDTAQFVVFSVGSEDWYLYAVPGEPINLTIVKEKFTEPTQIRRADKDLALIDGVMVKFFTSLKEQGVDVTGKTWLQNAIDKPEAIDVAIGDAKKNYASNAKAIDKIAPHFKSDLNLLASTFKSYIAIDNYSLMELENKLNDLSNAKMKLSDLSLPFYSEYIKDLTTAYAVRKLDSYHLELDASSYRTAVTRIASEAAANHIKNKDAKNIVFLSLIENEMKRYGVQRDNYLQYLFSNVDKAKLADSQNTYNKLKAKENMDGPRSELIDLTVYDVNGNAHTMDEFLGKLVYIDFWASWCAPCKAQIPYIKKLEEEYKGKDIVFVGISLDAKKDAWLKSVKEEGLHGDTFWAEGDFKHPVATTYGINSIPRFMMLDMEGKIISDDMIRPSQTEDLMKVINKELYQKELKGLVQNHINKIGGDKLLKGIGVEVALSASVMGLEIMSSSYYEYPSKIRMENYQMGSKDRSDKSNMKTTVIDVKDLKSKGDLSWLNKVNGFEVFLLVNELGRKFEFAPENFTNEENEYVLQTPNGGGMIKVFLGKDDFLLHKIIMESPVSARNGGGTSAATTTYSDYKLVDGVYVPFKRSVNGMLTISVEQAKIADFDDSLFISAN